MELSIRQNIEILPANPVISFKCHEHLRINSNGKAYKKQPGVFGWATYEIIGQAIINPRAIARAKKSVVIGE